MNPARAPHGKEWKAITLDVNVSPADDSDNTLSFSFPHQSILNMLRYFLNKQLLRIGASYHHNFKAEGFEACSWLSLGEITHVTRMQGAGAAGVYTASYLFKWIQHPLNCFA